MRYTDISKKNDEKQREIERGSSNNMRYTDFISKNQGGTCCVGCCEGCLDGIRDG